MAHRTRWQLDGLGAPAQRTLPGEDASHPGVRPALDRAVKDVFCGHPEPCGDVRVRDAGPGAF